MDRNFLQGKDGDRVNTILTGAGHTFRLILAWLAHLFAWILEMAPTRYLPLGMKMARQASP
ncbi:MAG: hypothetical protein K9H25_19590 [Rhodospirillum sp.]|nr:hypothetical protein [Rhodospirillum sp.]MCF8491283.1 hypothetical protein [Rhodospirillum sp.]MCF8501003.1 hypothetical protein [Rhodospirillum sp.]